jgi:hypothetical protein
VNSRTAQWYPYPTHSYRTFESCCVVPLDQVIYADDNHVLSYRSTDEDIPMVDVWRVRLHGLR